MKKLKILATIALSFLMLFPSQAKSVKKSPNIIYILADDLGYGDLGCYGQSKISTPNLDKMAAEGMLFTQHYSGSTVCAPSRSVLLTGQHTGHTPIRGNKELTPEGQSPMPEEAFTIAEMLKNQGYVTGAFGKWGLGFIGSEGDPNNQGFDEFYGYNCQRQAHRYYPMHLWHNDKKVMLEGNDFDKTVTYSGDLIHARALKFIEDNKKESFFMYYPNVIPHAELIMPEGKLMKQYRGEFQETPYISDKEGSSYGDDNFKVTAYSNQKEPLTTYAAMVSLLDQQVGEVIEKLKELGIDKNTIIMFSSDNGPHKEGGADPYYFNSNGGLKGIKRDLYEGGIRMPMIVRWPNTIEANTKTDHISAFWDVMPTMAALSGAEIPESTDGISFLPLLLNKAQKKHEYLYWEFHEKGGRKAVRKDNWKLVCLNCFNSKKMTIELYDLSKDIAEENNIAAQYPEIVEELIAITKEAHTDNIVFPFKKKSIKK